ncbi:MAG: hypothetical protein WC868_10940 [Bacteroidales bacterium]
MQVGVSETNMKNKTFEILLIILLVDILLVGVSFTPEIIVPFPCSNGLKIKVIDYYTLSDFSYKNNNEKADSLINAYLANDSINYGKLHRASLSRLCPKIKNNFLVNPENKGNYALDDFFLALLKEKDASLVRVAHYGDSQLEGDRITCYLRTNFQSKFGGSGVGFVPFNDIADNVNLVRYSSPNWIRYTVFHNRYGCGYYGLSGNVYKFFKYVFAKSNNDTLGDKEENTSATKINTQTVFNNATVNITLYPYVRYSKASLMYGRSSTKCLMNVYNQANNEKILTDTLNPSEGFTLHQLVFSPSVRSFTLEFSGDISPDFYGLLIDGINGVQIDNYAIRGHSGDGLLLINPDYLATQLKKLNVRLVIFQYGDNVVPCVNTDKGCEELEDMYYSIFTRFKNIVPDISILVIGAGDMAAMYNGAYYSYQYIPKIRDAQKNAALKAGCAFWDLFEVMGGANSILTWTNKGLASHDGHFTNNGQKVIGNELFNALMIEFNQYKFRQREKDNL